MATPDTKLHRFIDQLEESFIAITLGLMTLLTFANVIARYVFNSNILWALELTVFMFAWLVLIGASYCVKHSQHLGVDVVISALPKRARKVCALLSATACLAFALLFLKGAWDYWWASATRWAFLETNDVPMPEALQFFADLNNEGERYEKLPRFIPYFVLPVALALILLRYIQVTYAIIRGHTDQVIAQHESGAVTSELSEHSAPATPSTPAPASRKP
ncbi:MAG: TRAP transporter small permease [Pseudomonadota bacterium]